MDPNPERYARPNDSYMLNNKDDNVYSVRKPDYSILYVITHLIISFFALYLSWKCNGGFDIISFLVAFFCPYLYIMYALAAKGGCGVFDNVKV